MNIDDNLRIVGGHEVVPHSIPIQVSLQYKGINYHFCGGAVATENFVITAAHCCDGQNVKEIQAVAGDHNIKRDEGTEQIRNVRSIKMHPDYDDRTFSNDICLLELDEPFHMDEYVLGSTLPDPNQEFTGSGTVSGWGTLSANGPSSDTLQSVDVPIKTDKDCKLAYGDQNIINSMMCAGIEGKDSCQGDSGGPLTCDGLLCGIVSWGYGCALAGFPGVYTQTSYFVDWITNNIY